MIGRTGNQVATSETNIGGKLKGTCYNQGGKRKQNKFKNHT